jgi:serine protease
MSYDFTDELRRRTVLESAVGAGVALSASGVATATPPDGATREVLVGVSAGPRPPAAAVDPHLPDGASIVHENRTLGYVTVRLRTRPNARRSSRP